jgi:hypothetical protein
MIDGEYHIKHQLNSSVEGWYVSHPSNLVGFRMAGKCFLAIEHNES